MFRIHDARTGQLAPVQGARPGRLSTCLACPAGPGPVRLADLRACLVADLIRRVAERHNLRVAAFLRPPAGAAQAAPALRAACDDLNIYPAQSPADGLGEQDIAIAPDGRSPDGPAARWVAPAAASPPTLTPADVAERGLDPLALRLAFLARHYRTPLALAWEAVAAADQTLREWRRRVADWALSPGQPMTAPHLRDVLGALDDNLDTPAALATLRRLTGDGQVPDGSKFETFAYLDRLLGLDLAREVGR